MKKTLAIALLFAGSLNAKMDVANLAPACLVLACGEVMHMYKEACEMDKKQKHRSPDCCDNSWDVCDMAADVATAAVGAAVKSAVDKKDITVGSMTKEGVVSYMALKMSQCPEVNKMCSCVPGLRGIMSNPCNPKDGKAMNVEAMTRYAVCYAVCDWCVNMVKDFAK